MSVESPLTDEQPSPFDQQQTQPDDLSINSLRQGQRRLQLNQRSPQAHHRPSAAILEISVSDRGTLEDLSQSSLSSSRSHRKLLILKRRDVRVVEGARLESDFGEAHQVTPKHLVAQGIQRVMPSRCSSM